MDLGLKNFNGASKARHLKSTLDAQHILPCHCERLKGASQSYRLGKENKNCAFTLAEVLITLGIIGVVAALTIPTLMQKMDERETVSKLKKAYSTLSNAYSLISVERGDPTKWLQTDEPDEIGNIFAEHLNVAKNCGTSSGCFDSERTLDLSGNFYGKDINTRDDMAKLLLSDGTSVAFKLASPDCSLSEGNTPQLSALCGFITVNLNKGKPRNVFGKNIFEFMITKSGIVPYGVKGATGENFETYCKRTSSGNGCTAWVLYNENLDYLHCDDLSWDGKTKCD
ncbi:type II secretion system protein [bacterium]|nr:type II secretion system protein [bacterium]